MHPRFCHSSSTTHSYTLPPFIPSYSTSTLPCKRHGPPPISTRDLSTTSHHIISSRLDSYPLKSTTKNLAHVTDGGDSVSFHPS